MAPAIVRGNTQVVLEGRGTVTIRPSDHIATGGEGSIYRVGDSVVKMYLDPKEMRQKGIPDKLKILSGFNHSYVVSPRGLVFSLAGDPVGFYMPYVDGDPLSRVFTNEFWQKEGFTNQNASTLVDRMRQVVDFAHSQNALLVDANELNWFASRRKSEPEPHVVDVDSWALGRWPASVIMPSIRDWHAKTFDHKTDWFSWGVVTFQIYTGLHPYKGTLDGFDRGNLEGRMKAGASVFSSGVRLNRAVRDFSAIPAPLLSWYEATFQKGERQRPPSPFDTGLTVPLAAKVMRTVTTSKSGVLVFEKLLSRPNDSVVRLFHCGVVLLASGALVDVATKRQISTASSRACEVVKVDDGWLVADLMNQQTIFQYVEEGSLKLTLLDLSLKARSVLRYENRLFAVTENGLTEVKMHLLGKPIVSVGKTWGVMTNSTRWFNGCGVQDAMGATFVVVPFSDSSLILVRVAELDGLRVVAGSAGNRFVSVVCLDRAGEYQKFDLFFGGDYKSHRISKEKADGPELNVAILPKGVCATIVEDGQMKIFVPSNGQVNQIDDRTIATDMSLSNWGDRVTYILNGDLWSLRMK
ncbi:MAG: hypothetical protein KBC81_00215 [Candidatus Pacebacteria bacterium]|nr:hypothetical protein [Candidatus Paceibacterota bacterium]